jgi:hypothetical protein
MTDEALQYVLVADASGNVDVDVDDDVELDLVLISLASCIPTRPLHGRCLRTSSTGTDQ